MFTIIFKKLTITERKTFHQFQNGKLGGIKMNSHSLFLKYVESHCSTRLSNCDLVH